MIYDKTTEYDKRQDMIKAELQQHLAASGKAPSGSVDGPHNPPDCVPQTLTDMLQLAISDHDKALSLLIGKQCISCVMLVRHLKLLTIV